MPTESRTATDTILSIEDLRVSFPITGGLLKRKIGEVKAVAGVDLDIRRGETLGIVGESGCGKSTLGKALLRLIEPTTGTVIYQDGTKEVDVTALSQHELRPVRSKLQIIFQDPYSSLNPALTIFQSLRRGLETIGITDATSQRQVLEELFDAVNLRPEFLNRYPNEFSGGQRQRIAIVRALSVNPDFVVCDEAVSALDVSVQAQVLELLKDLMAQRQLTYMFISHNLSVVEYIADRIAVMYLGRVVELTDAKSLYAQPMHPYTQALLSAIPVVDPHQRRERIMLQGDVPSPANPPSGCPFHPRCALAQPSCAVNLPALRNLGTDYTPHLVACDVI